MFAYSDSVRMNNSTENAKSREKSWNCKQCDAKFISFGMLELHAKYCSATKMKERSSAGSSGATNEDDDYCDVCDQTFKSNWGLNIHNARIHHKYRLYNCGKCSEQFRNKKTLIVHTRSHTSKSQLGSGRRPRGRPPSSLKPLSANSTPTAHKSMNVSQPIDNRSSSRSVVPKYAANGKSQLKRRNNDYESEEENEEVQLVKRKPNAPADYGSGAMIAQYANMITSACAKGSVATYHEVDLVRGTIGKITFQFVCNACRGEKGVVRCYNGRAYCVTCCGHDACD